MQLLRLTYPPGKTLISIIKENRVYFLEDDRQKKKNPQIQLVFICQTNPSEFFERVTKEINDRKVMKAICLYFTQAFDKLSHQKLVGKREDRNKYYIDIID